jgi:arabinogalactan oligomer / maltooligosaccharide transport system permease protein
MSIEKNKVGEASGNSTLAIVLKFVALFFADAFALIIFYAMIGAGNLAFAVVIGLITVIANIIILRPELYPLRWMLVGFIFVSLFVIYPIYNTVYVAFTNYGDGHRETKEELLLRLGNVTYPAENTTLYDYVLYWEENNPENFALWLTRTLDDGSVETAWATVGAPIEVIEGDTVEAPESYQGYVRIPDDQVRRVSINVLPITFGLDEDTAQLRSLTAVARPAYQPRYIYDAAADTLLDQQTDILYVADDEIGVFVPQGGGPALNPGYPVTVGFSNFTRFFSDPRLQGPLLTIFIWTVMFAFLSVFTTFAAGLFLAIMLDGSRLPGKKIIRSLLIVPYAIPGVISIVIWRGMLNQELGVITNFIEDVLHFQVYWFEDVFAGGAWTRFIVILVNLWLGYPYMMLICSGALQAIPSDIYEAAAVDGASPLERFWNITLPLLLVSVGPLLIASFIYNFNNYLLLEALTQGNPPIPNSPTPAGYTDILIRYVYQLAFGNGVTADYGYASAISLIIFAIVGTITLFQYRITRTWEEVGENV